ncbi:MAG: hypothetical protein AABZ64_14015 [Nitrospinota bacterium]
MQRIKLAQAAPGMVTARPIEAPNGQALCAKGTVLSETLLARLQRTDITHVTVEGNPIDDGKAPKTLEGELADVDRRFQRAIDNKLMAALKVVVQKHIRKRYARMAGGAPAAPRGAPEAGGAADGPPPNA